MPGAVSFKSAGATSASEGLEEFRSGWRIVVAATLGVALGFPTLAIYSLGMFAPELAGSFHWSFGQIMGGAAVVTAVLLVAGPATGFLCDRFGARPVAVISAVLLGLSFMGFALSNGSLGRYYATWLIMSVLGAGCAQVTWARAVNQHFVVRRGLALGLALSGVGFFTFLGKPLTAALVLAVGWRGAYVGVGLLPILLVAPAALWGLPSRNAAKARGEGSLDVNTRGLTLREALRTRRFWTLAAAFLPMTFALAGPIPNVENILRHHSFSKVTVAAIAPWMGITIIAGRVAGGWLTDRIWAPLLACALLGLAGASCLILARPVIGYPEAVVAVLLLGAGIGVELDLTAYMTARYLGVRHYGLLYGLLYAVIGLGGGLGPGLFAWEFDRAGSYAPALILAAGGLVVAGALLLTLGRYPSFAAGTREGDNIV